MRLSVIVPTLDEQDHIGTCLEMLAACEGVDEVLVCDGGSRDLTPAVVAPRRGVRLLHSPQGRAQQMNHGALEARGEALWFLHADCLPPPEAAGMITEALRAPGVAFGAFRFAVDSAAFRFRYLETLVRIRAEVLGVPYGDQGLFMTKATFLAAGGFPEAPVMEDLYLVRRLRRRGGVRTLPLALPCSPRRWEARGFWRTSLRNWGLVFADWLGMVRDPGPSEAVRAWGRRGRAD